MKVKLTLPSSSTTKEQYEELRARFPKHKVVAREQLARFIHDARFDNGGKSWSEVAEILNDNKVVHSQWRRDYPAWDEQLVCQFAHRFGVAKKHIWRSKGNAQVAMDLDGAEQSLKALQGEKPDIAVNVSFRADGPDFTIAGELVCAPNSEPRINFQYEGVPDPHCLQFLQERGLPTTTSN